jgi:hypothetical protein
VHRVGPPSRRKPRKPFVPSSHRSRSRRGSQGRQTGRNEGACGNATMDRAARHLGHVDKPYPRRLSLAPPPSGTRRRSASTAIGWNRARPPSVSPAPSPSPSRTAGRPRPSRFPPTGQCPAARKRPPATPVEPALEPRRRGALASRRLPSWQWGSGSWQDSGRPLATCQGRCRIGTKMFTCGDRCSRQRRARAEGIYTVAGKAMNCWA